MQALGGSEQKRMREEDSAGCGCASREEEEEEKEWMHGWVQTPAGGVSSQNECMGGAWGRGCVGRPCQVQGGSKKSMGGVSWAHDRAAHGVNVGGRGGGGVWGEGAAWCVVRLGGVGVSEERCQWEVGRTEHCVDWGEKTGKTQAEPRGHVRTRVVAWFVWNGWVGGYGCGWVWFCVSVANKRGGMGL